MTEKITLMGELLTHAHWTIIPKMRLKQPSQLSMRKLEGLSVAKLEAAAIESLTNWFGDNSESKNAEKRSILKELFKVAKIAPPKSSSRPTTWSRNTATTRTHRRTTRRDQNVCRVRPH